jgi:F0F1-type ATP synthase epsilon subunit
MKEPWATPNRVNLLLKFAIRSKKIETIPEKNIKPSKKSNKNIQESKKKKKQLEKLKKTLENTKKRKRK